MRNQHCRQYEQQRPKSDQPMRLSTRRTPLSRLPTIMTLTSEPGQPMNPLTHRRHHQDNPIKIMIIQQQQQPDIDRAPQKNPNNNQHSQQQTITNNAIDPVYLDDDEVFYNLIIKENLEQDRKQSLLHSLSGQHLIGQQRHLLLSWMLKVCEHEYCEDDIFALATMILDKFLLFKPLPDQKVDENYGQVLASRALNRRRRLRIKKVRKKPLMSDFYKHKKQQQVAHHQFYCNEYNASSNNSLMNDIVPIKQDMNNHEQAINKEDLPEEDEDDEEDEIIDYDVRDEELRQRQLYLFAACSLLLASKLRQTPRLCVQILIELSRSELPVELTRDEILDGELLILSSLKWDLGSLVTPNDFLALILRKCHTLLEPFSAISNYHHHRHNHHQNQHHQYHHHHHHHQHPHHHHQYRCLSTSPPLSEDGDSLDHELGRTLIGRETAATLVVVPTGATNLETASALITPNSTPDEMIEQQQQQQQTARQRRLAKCDEFKVKRHTQTLLELCLMDSQLSQYSPSILAMASMAVAIDGLSAGGRVCVRLNDILAQVHEATHKVNELKLMIDVAHQIERYVQTLLNSTKND